MSERRDIKGLDTLRFVAALIVALSHGAAFPLRDWLGGGTGWPRLITGAYDVSFDGVAAVIVFFVISGFCIHYAPATGAPFRILPFWTRRGVRILIPLAGALALAAALGAAATGALEVVLWSVYCELIYYALYPLLRLAFRVFGLRWVLIASSAISAAMLLWGWREPFYWSFSPALTWLLAAPAWLLGCLLAERVATGVPVRGLGNVWFWRAAAWAGSAAATAVFFHAPFKVGYPLLLAPFQLVAFRWVWVEIQHFEHRPASRLLEWCGQWSYSLYLVHNIAIAMTPLAPDRLVLSWALRVAVVLAGALIFYAAVEAPAHWLARTASRRLAHLLPAGGVRGPGLAAP
ncbi:MAG TPA: acyltransferase family protein [Caulobacteraceae bacterium]|nr:acyltransferase family protein [Caulobacteraceae bacterium]